MSPRFPTRILTPWRQRWYPRLIAAGIALGLMVAVITSDGANTLTGRLGGDYPGFFAAGRILAAGDSQHLYDWDRQLAEQRALLPDGELLYFPYPPYTALFYWPLALLDFRWSYLLHTILAATALLWAIWLLRPVSRLIRSHYELAALGALLYFPLAKALLGAQNTTFTLLLIAGAWRAQHDGRPYVGGLLLGLLLYKPQFGLPLIALHAVAGRWHAVVAATAAAALLYGLGAWLLGPNWIPAWINQVSAFAEANLSVNGFQNVSWLGAITHLFGPGIVPFAVGGMLTVVTIAYLLYAWRPRSRMDLTTQIAIGSTGIVLLSPHTLFYDSALILIALTMIAERSRTAPWLGMSLIWIAGFGHLFAGILGFSTAFIAVLAVAWWTVRQLDPAVTVPARS